MKLFLNKVPILSFFFFINAFTILIDIYIEIIDCIKFKQIFIRACGNKYINEYNIPFILKLEINADIENPSIKLLKKYITRIIGIAITIYPKSHITIIEPQLKIREFIKLSI